MTQLIWAIVKDGLKALAFWIVASIVMIFLWGYTGRMLSMFLGLIFIVSFIGANLKRIVVSIPGIRAGGMRSAPLPGQSQSPLGESNRTQCLTCSGAGRTTCYGCNGAGTRFDGVQTSLCFICSGQRSLTCGTCSGSGVVYR